MFQQSFGSICGANNHGVNACNIASRSVLWLEASSCICWSSEGTRFFQSAFATLCELFVVLELGCIILINTEGGRRHLLHILRSHRDRLMRPGVVGLRRLIHMVPPSAAVPGHLARQILLQSLDGSVHHSRRIAVHRVLLPMHHAPPAVPLPAPGIRYPYPW